MLRQILDQNLIRFSTVIRAADVWFGLRWDSATPRVIKENLAQVLRFLDDPKAARDALANEKGETLYFALWTMGFQNANAAVAAAAPLLSDPDVERRFLGVHFLAQLGVAGAAAELAKCLEDADLRIVLRALEGMQGHEGPEHFARLEKLLSRMPQKPKELEPLVWPWTGQTADRSDLADDLVEHLGDRPPTVLIPYLPMMGMRGRAGMVTKLAEQKKWDSATRDTLFALVGDKDSWVRNQALEAVKKCEVSEEEAVRIEDFLSRKNSALRQGVLTLLRKQKMPAPLASADRLLASKKTPQRLAGLELVRELVEAKRAVEPCRERARAYQAQHTILSEEEEVHLEVILDIQRVRPTLDDALGLMDPSQRSKAVLPRTRKVHYLSAAALACLKSLDELIKSHRETTVKVTTYQGAEEMLLGNVTGWWFPSPDSNRPATEDAARLPLREVWEEWWQKRPGGQRDKDGLEVLRASMWSEYNEKSWRGHVKRFSADHADFLKQVTNGLTPVKLGREDLVGKILEWLLRLHPPTGAADFLLDAVENAFALVPEKVRSRVVDIDNWQKRQKDWRAESPAEDWLRELFSYRRLHPDEWTNDHSVRLWQLLHWRDEPVPGVARFRPLLEFLLAGYKAGQAIDTDLFDQLLGPGSATNDLSELTAPQPPEAMKTLPGLKAVVDRCRERILEIELKRGELPTAASAPAQAIRSLHGLDTLLRLIQALGKKPFSRERYGAGEGRASVLTHLIGVTYPRETDTAEVFATQIKKAGIFRERLLQLAFLAPQWLPQIHENLGWDGFTEGVYWFLAHMTGGRSGVPGVEEEDFDEFEDDFGDLDEDFEGDGQVRPKEKKLNPWEKLISERTPLTPQERREGAVDVNWFQRVYAPLGAKRWEQLADAARYGCGDNSYKKAAYLAQVLLGKAKKRDLVAGIREKNLRESVRLLGLLPLTKGDKREPDLLGRYRVLLEYRRYAKQLGPMSKEGALRAVAIGMENPARTAGYPDPVRLEWAMEAHAIADLAKGPISVTQEGVTVTLALDDKAQAEVTIRRGDKPLEAIPPAVRKHPKVAALTERKTELRRQASRMRESLEMAMCRGDTFTGAELRQLVTHPILVQYLQRLVLIGEGIIGYPVSQGQGLEDTSGKVEPIKPDEKLRLAHPHDLLTRGDWEEWQRHLFRVERVQPYKQVFRELYVVTKQEKSDGNVSHRYAGHQVNPTQAMALFGSRLWSTRDGVSKTFYDAGFTASVSFRYGGGTPLEVEGLTLEGVQFTRRGEWQPIPLKQVPPRIFSEVMRDVDLVVSVAHRGGVDPEASASTVEMRAALLRETCGLLQIKNYRIKDSHVLIDGTLGKYSVHLGSANVHRMPGGSVCLVPVHSQHRGRLFLPFADDDPRTAEVLSKVIVLARDNEIQDPNILDQLR
jgi:hypothetical protein